MAKTVPITITRSAGASQATFGANPIMNAGDDAFWTNADPHHAHRPAPLGQPPDTWLQFDIPPMQPGGRPQPSDGVSFDYSGDYPYACTLHPHETGVVRVS